MTIAENIATVRALIAESARRAGRDPSEVTLIAVSKTHPANTVLEAVQAGMQHFGENRVEESIAKIPAVAAHTDSAISWHMIGHIQSRKAKSIPPLFAAVHSVDSERLASKLAQAANEVQKRIDVFIEVNVSGEASKEGFALHDWSSDQTRLSAFCRSVEALAALDSLHVIGFMTMAPIVGAMEQTRPVFDSLRRLRDAVQASTGIELPALSMGMTDDYPVAVEEGATHVRVGRAIFGERQAMTAE